MAEIQRLARRYADTAQAITRATSALQQIHGSATAWNSDAGRAFRERTITVADAIGAARDRYEETAEALATYARTLDGLQTEADLALARAKRAEEAQRTASRARERNASLPAPDPAVDGRAQEELVTTGAAIRTADAELADLEDSWRSAGQVAADAIEEISTANGLADDSWDDVLHVVAGVTALAGELSAAFGVMALVCSVIPGLQALAAVLGGLALVTCAVSLAGNVTLYANDCATLSDVIWDTVGVLSFGAGRAFALAGRAMTTGTRGLARSSYIGHLQSTGITRAAARSSARAAGVPAPGTAASALASRARNPYGWLPTRGEWAAAYRPSRLVQDAVPGPAPFIHPATMQAPEVAAGVDRANRANAVADVVEAVDAVVGAPQDLGTVEAWSAERQPATPVAAR